VLSPLLTPCPCCAWAGTDKIKPFRDTLDAAVAKGGYADLVKLKADVTAFARQFAPVGFEASAMKFA
jgi:hypothetical protein